MKWFTEMAKHYSAALCYYGKKNMNNPKYQELLTSVENKCLKYFRLLSDNEHLSYMEKIVNEFEKVPPLKYTLTAYMSRYYFIHALQLYEEKQLAKHLAGTRGPASRTNRHGGRSCIRRGPKIHRKDV